MLTRNMDSLLLCTGAGVRVAVLDSGLHPAMPAFRDREVNVFDCRHNPEGLRVLPLSPLQISDRNGHGSYVQSCLYSAAPDVEVDHYRVLGENNTCDGTLLCYVIDHVIQQDYNIIHLSLGTRNEDYLPWLVTLMKRAYEKNICIVAACSNIGNSLYPARFTFSISCEASEGSSPLQLWFRPRNVVEFSTWGINVPVVGLDGRERFLTGSSYAAAHLTGLVARAIELQGHSSPLDTKILLREYALRQEKSSIVM